MQTRPEAEERYSKGMFAFLFTLLNSILSAQICRYVDKRVLDLHLNSISSLQSNYINLYGNVYHSC